MAEGTTVKQLADMFKMSVPRVLQLLEEARLPHRTETDLVTPDQRHAFVGFMQRRAGGGDAVAAAPTKLTLTRTTHAAVRAPGAGMKSRTIDVAVKKKRVYVKRDASDESPVAEASAAPELVELEPIAELAPVIEAAPVVEEAPEVEVPAIAEEVPVAEEAVGEASLTAAVPAAAPRPTAPRAGFVGAAQAEAERNRAQDLLRQQAQDDQRRQVEQRAADERRRVEDEARREKDAKDKAELQRRADADLAAKREEETARQKREGDKPKEKTAAAPDARPAGPHGARDKGKGKREGGGDDFGDGLKRRRELKLASDRGNAHRRKDRAVRGQQFERPPEFIAREVEIPESITVGELASRMSVKASELVKKLFNMGVMATINQAIDQETAVLVVEELGHRAKSVSVDAVEHAFQEAIRKTNVKGEGIQRPPVVTVMGHVDHGKTSLLDRIRQTNVVSGEAGGITQHIGAYHVQTSKGGVTFIDTPGHAAFTAMRARGARVTDIVILVVAADDGVMPQTAEAIDHAKAAKVPIVVAVNKVDKQGIDLERVRNELAVKNVIPDAWGGDTQFINVSALTGQGIDELLDAVLLQAELLELRAVPEAAAQGVVVESRLDKGRGPVATVLVQNGTLRRGDIIVAGTHFGRVRAMRDDTGANVDEAGPAIPVEVLGLSGVPGAGDEVAVVADERSAREITEFRQVRSTEQRMANQQVTKLDALFANLKEGEKPTLNILLKTDVRGSLEAISHAIGEMKNQEVGAQIIGSGIGGITEGDANLALASKALLFGFNVRADPAAKKIIERENIDLRYYSVIYELLDDIKTMLSGMLSPEIREEILGVAEVREVFRSPKFGQVAGCMVTEGTLHRNRKIRVLRDNVVIFEGELESLRRFKDDVGEVRAGFECGIGVRNYNDVRERDKIEVFEVRQVARTL